MAADSTITTMSDVLKNVYLDSARYQINIDSGPLYQKLIKTSEGVDGENIRIHVNYGIMGGFSSPSTDALALPTANAPKGVQLTSTTKNLLSTFRITDKIIKASKKDIESFGRAIEKNMDGCIKAASFHTGRQMFMDGTGNLATYSSGSGTTSWVVVTPGVQYLVVGMIVNQINGSTGAVVATTTVTNVDRTTNTVTFEDALTDSGNTDHLCIQGSSTTEMNGMGVVYANTGTYLGVNRANNKWFVPQMTTLSGAISDAAILAEVHKVERYSGGNVDMLVGAYDVIEYYYDYLESMRTSPNTMELEGGYKAIKFNGMPLVKDKFALDGYLYGFDTASFKIHQLDEWDWQAENGEVLSKVSGYPMYQAVFAYYADLICEHPGANMRITAITS